MLSTRKSFIWCSPGIRVGLEGVVTSLTGAKSDNLVEAVNKYLAIAYLSGLGGTGDCLDSLIYQIVSKGNFELDLRQKIHDIFSTPV